MKRTIAIFLTAALLLSLCACGSGKPADVHVDLAELYESYESYLPTMYLLDDNTMVNFLGIDPQDCAQASVSICMDGMRADEVWLIEAVDEDALSRLQALANNRIEAKKAETISYSPDQYVIVEKAVLIVQGNYLALLVSPEVEAMSAAFGEAFK